MNLLVTAGPTREPIDAVRFLSNRSTGRQGFAVAEAALERNWTVTLIAGPTHLTPPPGCRYLAVETAAQMRQAVLDIHSTVDAVVMTAAVADYRPTHPETGKRKKSEGPWTLTLERTGDILAELGVQKGNKILVGFALESEDLRNRARQKLSTKNLDLIVANDPSAFGGEHSSVVFLRPDGSEEAFPSITKRRVADCILDAIVTKQGAS